MDSDKKSKYTILISLLAVIPFGWDLLQWVTQSVFDWFWTGTSFLISLLVVIGVLSLVTIFYVFGLARSLKSQSKQDALVLKNSKEVVGIALEEFTTALPRIVQHTSQEKPARKLSLLSHLERFFLSSDSSTWEIKLHLCAMMGVSEMSVLFRASKAIRYEYLVQAKFHAELSRLSAKTKEIRKLERIFPVWKEYGQKVGALRLTAVNVMQENLEKLAQHVKRYYLPESVEISSKDPFHKIVELLIDNVFDEYFSPFQIEAVTQTLEKTLNDVVSSKIPATTIKITNFTSGTSYPQATSMLMLETGEIQVGIEWIPVGAEISLNIDFLILSALSHLSLTIPLQRLNLKANVWFPTKPPYDVHISLVEMPQLIYPIDARFGLLPLPNPMAFEGLKDAIKSKLQEATWSRFVQPGVFVLPINFGGSLGYDKIQDEMTRLVQGNVLMSEHKAIKRFLDRYTELAGKVRRIGPRDNNDLPNRNAIVVDAGLISYDVIDWVMTLKNSKTTFIGKAAFKSYNLCIKALEPEEVFPHVADQDTIDILTNYVNEEPENLFMKEAKETARILTLMAAQLEPDARANALVPLTQQAASLAAQQVKKMKLKKIGATGSSGPAPLPTVPTTQPKSTTKRVSSATAPVDRDSHSHSSSLRESPRTSFSGERRSSSSQLTTAPTSTTSLSNATTSIKSTAKTSSERTLATDKKKPGNTLPPKLGPSKSYETLATSTVLKLSTKFDISLAHGSILSKDGKIKNASQDTWYLTFPASYQGIYIGPLTKSLNLKTGSITIKNLSNDMDLKLSSYRIHGDAIDVVKKGQFILEPFKTKIFQFCKEWTISVSHTMIELVHFTDQIEGRHDSDSDLLLMATNY